MNPRSGWLALLLLGTMLISADGALAFWPSDGVMIFSTAKQYNQYFPKAVTDGAGGAIVAFLGGSPEILQVQRIDSNGEIRWGPDGMALSFPTTESPDLSPDGSGGAFVAWYEGNLLVQHLDASGVRQWPGRALTISSLGSPRITADGAGGCLIVYGATSAQRVSPTGSLMWGPTGVDVIHAPPNGHWTGNISPRAIAADGTGGLYVVTDDPDYGPDGPTRLVRVNGAGEVVWIRTVSAVSDQQATGGLVSDGANGVFVGWWTYDVSHTQHLDLDGNILWDPAGVPGYPYVTDGTGGAVLISDDGVARGVSGSGAPLWTSDGPVFGNRSWASYAFRPGVLQADGTGGYIARWPAFGGGDSLYGQRLSSTGERLWTNDGILLTAKPYLLMVPVGDGGLIYFFRSGPDYYTQTPRAKRLFPVPGVGVSTGVASTSFLARPTPNPARSRAYVEYGLSETGAVKIEVFGLDGRRIKTLVQGVTPAGSRHAEWDLRTDRGDAVRPGVYLLRMKSGGTTHQRKLVVRG